MTSAQQSDILHLGLLARRDRHDSMACELFSKLHRADPTNADYQYFYGDSLRLLARYGEAENLLLTAYRQTSANHFLASIALARMYETTGRYHDAETWFRVATTCKSEDTMPWVYLGNFLYKQSRSREAIDVLKNGLVASGPVEEVNTCIALCHRSLGEYEDARARCIEALRIDPSDRAAKEILNDVEGAIRVISG